MLSDRRVHATLPTLDVDALRPFYEDVLGFTPRAVRAGRGPVRRRRGHGLRDLADGHAVELDAHPDGVHGLRHRGRGGRAARPRGRRSRSTRRRRPKAGSRGCRRVAPRGSRIRTATSSASSSSTTRPEGGCHGTPAGPHRHGPREPDPCRTRTPRRPDRSCRRTRRRRVHRRRRGIAAAARDARRRSGIGTGAFREHIDALVDGGATLFASGMSSKARGLTTDALGGLPVDARPHPTSSSSSRSPRIASDVLRTDSQAAMSHSTTIPGRRRVEPPTSMSGGP